MDNKIVSLINMKTPNKKPNIVTLRKENIATIVNIAKPIWHQHYDPIIGVQQVNYMLDKFQSVQAMETQLTEGYRYFEVLDEEETVGYFSLQIRNKTHLFISKFYLLEKTRGQGFGTAMLIFIENYAKKNNCQQLKLTVNRHNPAYQIYLKLGFVVYDSAQVDIGSGYIMDDYLMSKNI